jgi:hypothetical protein
MLKISVRQLSEPCLWCRDGRELAFDFTDECLSLHGLSYHHENEDLLAFAEQLRQLERFRQGSATLVSKGYDSELRLKFARPGGELWFSAKHWSDGSQDEQMFHKEVSYCGEVDGEHVGTFLNTLIKEIEDTQPRRTDADANLAARADRLLESIARRLDQAGYRVSRNIALPWGPIADICASRNYLSWKRLAVVSEHLVVKWVQKASVMDMRWLWDGGFQHVRNVTRTAFLQGGLFRYVIVPVIITGNPRPELMESVTARPPRRWSLVKFPVVIELSTGKASCFVGADMGRDSFADARAVVADLLEGDLV